jgi:PAS domain S-box-containing protein
LSIVKQGLLIIALPLLVEVGFVAGLVHMLEEADKDIAKEEHSKLVMRTAEEVGMSLLRSYTLLQNHAWFGESRVSKAQAEESLNLPFVNIKKLAVLERDDPLQSQRIAEVNKGTNALTKAMYLALESEGQQQNFLLANDNPLAREFSEKLTHASSWTLYNLDQIAATETQRELRQGAERAQHRHQFRIFIAIGVVANAIAAIVVAIGFYLGTVRRLAQVFDNTRRLADSKPLNPVLPGKDEIAHLDSAFHTMANSLVEASRKQKALIDNARDVICSLNPKGKFVAISNASTTVFGFAPEELAGAWLTDYVPEGEQKRTVEELQLIKSSSAERPPFETQFRRKDGRTIDILLSAIWSEIDDTIFCVIHDISEQKAAERLRQEVTQMVSHDLRSPLTAIQSFHTLLDAGIAGQLTSKGTGLLHMAERSTSRMLRLINDLLDIEKMDSGKLALDKAEVSLSSLFEQSVNGVTQLANDKGVTVTAVPTDLVVSVDGHRIVQVLVNLMGNALKFSPSGSTVTVSGSTLADGLVEIRVADQGRGIPPHLIKSIFNRFEQVQSSDSKEKGGSGLGLAICKALVELHGGEISVESELDKGSTFIFRIPCLVASPSSVPKSVLAAENSKSSA